MSEIVLHCEKVTKQYDQGGSPLVVLNDIHFSIHQRETIAIVGASGAGKSTLLNLMGGLDQCSAGHVEILGQRLDQLSLAELARLRNEEIGFVYQFHHLLSEFDACENVAMPLLIGGMKKNKAFELANAMLERVGLYERRTHRPAQLSGGERQRVAIARALVNEPSCIMMDEPTGNLDEQTAKQIRQLLAELNDSVGTSFIIVTHDMEIAAEQSRIFTLHDGQLHEQA